MNNIKHTIENINNIDCNLCKYVDVDKCRCKKRRKQLDDPFIVALNNCHYYDSSFYRMFMDFFDKTWKENEVYFTTDFTERFNISRHLVRHYLFDIMVRNEKVLFRVKRYNKSYYFMKTYDNMRLIGSLKYGGIIMEHYGEIPKKPEIIEN
jgi:hypothetical protein